MNHEPVPCSIPMHSRCSECSNEPVKKTVSSWLGYFLCNAQFLDSPVTRPLRFQAYGTATAKLTFLSNPPQPPSTATRPVEPVEPVHEATRGRRAGFAYLKATLAHPVCCTCQSFEIYASL